MEAVGLEQVPLFCHARQEEGDQGEVVRGGQLQIDLMELLSEGGAVIGRQAHADQQYFRRALLRGTDDSLEIGPHLRDGKAAQTVVCAQFQYEDVGMMTVQKCGNAAAAARGGFTADAGIDQTAVGTLLAQAPFQQAHPALVLLQAVGGA